MCIRVSGYGVLGFDFGSNNIQNGGYEAGGDTNEPDSISLSNAQGECIELISYEGTMSPADGPCADYTSNDIGVREVDTATSEFPNSTQVGESLQKSGSGTVSSDFTWNEPADDSKGSVNPDQTFGNEPTTFTVTSTALDYYIDGVLHASVTLQRGKTYIFDVSDFGKSHPFRFSTTPDGTFGGGVAYEGEGVDYSDDSNQVVWTVPADFELGTMYYYCTLHAGMAGSGVITFTD